MDIILFMEVIFNKDNFGIMTIFKLVEFYVWKYITCSIIRFKTIQDDCSSSLLEVFGNINIMIYKRFRMPCGIQQIGANILEQCATRYESRMVVPIYMVFPMFGISGGIHLVS